MLATRIPRCSPMQAPPAGYPPQHAPPQQQVDRFAQAYFPSRGLSYELLRNAVPPSVFSSRFPQPISPPPSCRAFRRPDTPLQTRRYASAHPNSNCPAFPCWRVGWLVADGAKCRATHRRSSMHRHRRGTRQPAIRRSRAHLAHRHAFPLHYAWAFLTERNRRCFVVQP